MAKPLLTILIADDDAEDLELLEHYILAVEPATKLHIFSDGLMAFEHLCNTSPDELPTLLVLDYNMPGLNGAQVLEALKDEPRYSGIPKIVLSSSNTAKYIDECLSNGATEYLVKPSTMQGIRDLAQKLVAMAREPQTNGK